MQVVSCWTLYQNQNEKEQILDRQIQFMLSKQESKHVGTYKVVHDDTGI